MAIVNYGDLKTELNRLLAHPRFISDYDNQVIKFEASANRRLRVRQMETSSSLTSTSGDVALPSDYLVWRTIRATERYPYFELDYVHPAYLPTSTEGPYRPQLFTIEGSMLRVRPVDDVNPYEFHYYARIPTLTGSSDSNTNWLLTAYPDLYVSGTMVELAALGRNLELAQLYKARRDELLQEIIQLSALTTGATSPSVRTADYF